MASDKTQIQTFADWPVSHAKRVTKDSRQNPEYHVVVAIRRLQLRTDKNCPAEKSWPNHVKNEQHIPSKNTYDSKNILNTMMQEISSEHAAGFRRICNRSSVNRCHFSLRSLVFVKGGEPENPKKHWKQSEN